MSDARLPPSPSWGGPTREASGVGESASSQIVAVNPTSPPLGASRLGPPHEGEGGRVRVPTRNAGFVACLIGVLVMLSGRYVQSAPPVFIYVGVSVIVFGWGLLALSVFRVKS